MNEDEENEEHGGDSATTPVQEVHQPSPTSREEPPLPIGPKLDKDKIVLDSLDIIASYLRNINDQKHYLASIGFMLNTMQGLLDERRDHGVRLNAFLVNNERLQTQWFLMYHKILPPYGDYTLALKDSPDAVMVDQIPSPVKESILKELADDAMHNMHAGGWQVKAQRTLDLSVEAKMEIARELTDMDAVPFPSWMAMLAKEIGHEDTLEDKFFEVSAFLDFLNHSAVSDTGN